MASQLRAASQRSAGAFGGFPTPSQFIEEEEFTILSQPHHEVVSSSILPDLDIPGVSLSPLSESTTQVSSSSQNMSQDDVQTLSQKEQRLAKVRLHLTTFIWSTLYYLLTHFVRLGHFHKRGVLHATA